MAVVYLVAFWLAGLWLSTAYLAPPHSGLLLAITGLILALLWRHKRLVMWGALSIAVLGTALFRVEQFPASLAPDDVSTLNGGLVLLEGKVAATPEVEGATQRLVLQAEQVETDGYGAPASGVILVLLPRYPTYAYGQQLALEGGLQSPRDLGWSGYAEALARQRIHSVLRYPVVLSASAFEPSADVYAALTSLRSSSAETLRRLLPEPQAGIAVGLLLGDRGGISSRPGGRFSS